MLSLGLRHAPARPSPAHQRPLAQQRTSYAPLALYRGNGTPLGDRGLVSKAGKASGPPKPAKSPPPLKTESASSNKTSQQNKKKRNHSAPAIPQPAPRASPGPKAPAQPKASPPKPSNAAIKATPTQKSSTGPTAATKSTEEKSTAPPIAAALPKATAAKAKAPSASSKHNSTQTKRLPPKKPQDRPQSPALPPGISKDLLRLRSATAVPNIRLIVAEKPSVALEISRVLSVRNKGSMTQGFFGELFPLLNSKFKSQQLRAAKGQGPPPSDAPSAASTAPVTIVSWCFGHMLQIESAEPQPTTSKKSAASGPGGANWRLENLPRVPEKFKLVPLPAANATQLEVLRILFTKAKGREGELIFRDLYEYFGAKAPVKRLWISAQTDEAIRTGFQRLFPSAMFDSLYQAARCRRIADWLFGINFTEFYTLTARWRPELELDESNDLVAAENRKPATQFSSSAAPTALALSSETSSVNTTIPVTNTAAPAGGARPSATGAYQALFSVGRVQTPVLRFVVERYIENWAFKSKTFYELKVSVPIKRADGTEDTVDFYFPPAPTEPSPSVTATTQLSAISAPTSFRFPSDKATLQVSHALGAHLEITDLKISPKTESPPLLYDLNTLQIEANQHFALPAAHVLSICQQLYEKKMITYPRTNSRFLPPSYAKHLDKTVRNLAECGPYKEIGLEVPALTRIAKLDTRIFNESKVTDHHAIVPTNPAAVMSSGSSESEATGGSSVVPEGGLPRQKKRTATDLLAELDLDERRVYDLIVLRTFAALAPSATRVEVEFWARPEGSKSATATLPSPLLRATSSYFSDIGWHAIHKVKRIQLEQRLNAMHRAAVARRRRKHSALSISFSPLPSLPTLTPAVLWKEYGLQTSPPQLAAEQTLPLRAHVLKRATKPPALHSDASLLYIMQNAAQLFGSNATAPTTGATAPPAVPAAKASGGIQLSLAQQLELLQRTKDATQLESPFLHSTAPPWGLGTPSTRAQTIQKLLKVSYAKRVGRLIVPTRKGVRLIKLIQDEPVASVLTTASWEQRLQAIAENRETASSFLKDIRATVRAEITRLKHSESITMPFVVDHYHYFKGQGVQNLATKLADCPKCRSSNTLVWSQWDNIFCSTATCNFFIPLRLRIFRGKASFWASISAGEADRLLRGEEIIVEVTRGSGLMSEEDIVKSAARETVSPAPLARTATAAAAAYVKALADQERANQAQQTMIKLPPVGFLHLQIDKANRCHLRATFKPNPLSAMDPVVDSVVEKTVPLESLQKRMVQKQGKKATTHTPGGKNKSAEQRQMENIERILDERHLKTAEASNNFFIASPFEWEWASTGHETPGTRPERREARGDEAGAAEEEPFAINFDEGTEETEEKSRKGRRIVGFDDESLVEDRDHLDELEELEHSLNSPHQSS